MGKFTRYLQVLQPSEGKRVKSMDIKVVAERFHGELVITDIMFQAGKQATAYIPNTAEILKLVEATINENDTAVGNDVYQDYQPRIFPGVTNRFFNLVGRGHEVIVVPNVYHENHAEPIITTGLDFTIYPKNDYDLLRISTNFGTELEYGVFSDVFEEHPLHWRYTREFYLDGASAGTEIKLHASTRTATVGGVPQPLGVRHIDVGKVNGESRILTTPRQAFMVAPVGSYRIRVEFYKRVTEIIEDEWGGTTQIEYMKDTGIGFQGVVEFIQYALGGGRI